MSEVSKPLLDAFRNRNEPGRTGNTIPFWFMRQAGRYLPEYRQVRSNSSGFLDMCYSPDKASEVTLQPIRRFGMDGAIIFSDILVIPHALGVEVRFEEKIGPLLAPVTTQAQLDGLVWKKEKLAPVYEALRRTRAALPQEKTLIGFAGSPWTLACYTVQGKSDKEFHQVRSIALRDRAFFSRLISMFVDCVSEHAAEQVESGADIIQLFDSWSGVLSESEFEQWVIEPTARIVKKIRSTCPDVPIIGFPRQAGVKYGDYVEETGVDGVNIDSSVSLGWARKELQGSCVLQGNLDPLLLAEDKAAMLAQAKQIISLLGDKSFVFNLGHGILPHTPVENVQALCDLLKNGA
jgi:uroporphyrinogen decarboxylase